MALALGKLTTGTPQFRGSGFVGIHVKPITTQEKFNFPRANAILARAQALLWVRDCRRSSLRGGDQTREKNHRLPNPESLPRSPRLQAQRLLKNMKFEGIEIAQFQIPSRFQISSSISIPSNFIFFKSLCGGESHKFKLQIYAANKKYR